MSVSNQHPGLTLPLNGQRILEPGNFNCARRDKEDGWRMRKDQTRRGKGDKKEEEGRDEEER